MKIARLKVVITSVILSIILTACFPAPKPSLFLQAEAVPLRTAIVKACNSISIDSHEALRVTEIGEFFVECQAEAKLGLNIVTAVFAGVTISNLKVRISFIELSGGVFQVAITDAKQIDIEIERQLKEEFQEVQFPG